LLFYAFEEFQKNMFPYPNTIRGVFSQLQDEFQLFDVDDPIEQLRRFQEELNKFAAGETAAARIRQSIEGYQDAIESLTKEWVIGASNLTREEYDWLIRDLNRKIEAAEAELERIGEGLYDIPALSELLGLDASDPAQRAEMQRIIEQLYRDLVAGVITPEMLGAVTMEEAIEILKQMEGLLDEIAEETGETQNVMRSVSITEVQANQLLAYQSTIATIQARIERILTDIFNLMLVGNYVPPPVGAPSVNPITGQSTGEINVDISIGTIELADAESREQAEAFIDELMEELKRRLGEELKSARQRQGDLN
jgi:hypothetical protein